MEDLWTQLVALPGAVFKQFLLVLAYPFDSSTRIFIGYIATSLLFAIWVFDRAQRRDPSAAGQSLFRFLFPREIWSNPSAWLDVRYFFIHQMVRLLIYGALTTTLTVLVFDRFSAWFPPEEPTLLSGAGFGAIEILYIVLVAAVVDFAAYGAHYLQHKVPVLWAFHKVHHSATVMHPLTNYREHPVDNLLYALVLGVCLGTATAGISALIGYVPDEPTILGIGVFMFVYNALGYNLRHSHIWLRWPGKLSYLFGSPAHHQVHHSYHPEHIDKNFAFMFPIWDVLFGTYCVPQTNKDVRFGLGADAPAEFHSVLDLYFKPFREAYARLFRR